VFGMCKYWNARQNNIFRKRMILYYVIVHKDEYAKNKTGLRN